MEVDVGAYIADLLYEHDVVNLPGLGSFTGQYQSADIDHVQGRVHPPSKELAFNANLVLDDGVLVQYIQKKHLLSVKEAQRIVEDYVRQVQQALRNKEIVVFPKLGKLFQDYEGSLKFIAEGVNFNTDSYGLPPVQFYPINRLEPPAGQTPGAASKDKPRQKKEAKDWVEKTVDWFDRHILYFIGVVSVFIIFIIYWFFIHNPSPDTEASVPEIDIPTERFNTSPSQPREEISAVPPEEQNAPAAPSTSTETESPVDTEEPTIAPDQKSAIILIGVFGNAENVERLIQKLYQAGFEPYTEKAGNLTRVGIQFAYETEAELQSTLRDVQRKFEPNARIKEL